MANTVNTRLILRNDHLSNWNVSTKPLLKGEAALAQLSGELSNYFQLRIGVDGKKTWKDLEPSNILIPSQNITGLDYDNYQLSALDAGEGEQSKFQLVGHNPKTGAWTAIGEPVSIPAVDFSAVNERIDGLTASVNDITATTIPNVKSELTKYTDDKIDDLQTKVTEAAEAATAYTNSVSAQLSTDYQKKYDDVLAKIKDGIHFIGKVDDIGVTSSAGWYKKTVDGQQIAAANGDLVIKNNVEYVYSAADAEWAELGDEGTWASKSYVDTAKSDAIAATKNSVQQVSAYAELKAGTNTGDIGVVKAEIGSTGTYEYTAYTWSAELTAWKQMDGNYSADSVIMPANMRITKQFGKYTIPTVGYRDLTCAGMTLKTFINDAFAETASASKVNPTATFTGPTDIASTNKEVGEYATTLPGLTFKYTADGYYSTFNNNLKAGNVCKLSSVYIERQAIAAEDLGDSSHNVFNLTAINDVVSAASTVTTDVAVNGTVALNAEGSAEISVQYTDASIQLAKYKASAAWLQGTAVPKNNIGADDPSNKIAAGSWTYNSNNWFTVSLKAGNRKRFWYVGTDSTTAANSAFMRTTGNGHGSDFNSTSKTISLTIPAGTKRAIYAVLSNTATLKSVIDVDGMGLDIKDKFTTTHDVDITGANGFTAQKYTLFTFVNENGASATTFNITLN